MAEAWRTGTLHAMTEHKSFQEGKQPDSLSFSSFLDGRFTAVGKTSLIDLR